MGEGTGGRHRPEGAAWEIGYCHVGCVSLGRKKRWAVISENQQVVINNTHAVMASLELQ